MKILIVCNGNSCRSQMTESFLKKFDPLLEVYSAGLEPLDRVNPLAIKVMKEKGIDISNRYPKPISKFLNQDFDYIVTISDKAQESLPSFNGKVKNHVHLNFEDPSKADGFGESKLEIFRKVRDSIEDHFYHFYKSHLVEA